MKKSIEVLALKLFQNDIHETHEFLHSIKDEYFDIVDDDTLMKNHERGKKRPTYFTIKKRFYQQ